MKSPLAPLLGLTLLLAGCGQSAPSKGPLDSALEIPAVPRTVSQQVDCSQPTIANELFGLLGPDQRDRGHLVHLGSGRLSAQEVSVAPSSVADLLYTTKQLLNTFYFGYSAVDLQGLHETAYQSFKKSFPNALNGYTITPDADPLMSRYITGVGDDHTYYLNEAQYRAEIDESNDVPAATASFGFSMVLLRNSEGILITDVRGDSPAFAAGLRRGDVIVAVNGQVLTRTVPPVINADGTVDDSGQSTVYNRLLLSAKQQPTATALQVRHGSQTRTVTLSAKVLTATELPWGEVQQDANGHSFYYLRIPTFSGLGIAERVHTLVARANAEQVGGVIVDLRDNGGGFLSQYVGAVGAFVPDKAGEKVRYIDASETNFSYQNGAVKYFTNCTNTPKSALTIAAPSLWTGKVAVLIDSGSASASEMFSQNIRQGGAAILIGEETYGVGNTATLHFQLPANRGLSVTTGRVFVGDQAATQTAQPDVTVANNTEALGVSGNDEALNKAMTVLAH